MEISKSTIHAQRVTQPSSELKPDVTSCAVPKGIFKDTGGSAVQFIGYGDELNIDWPPKPKDPKIPHEYIWTMKLRNKSTGMLPLGMDESRDDRSSKGRKSDQDAPPDDAEKRGEVPEKTKGPLDKVRGISGSDWQGAGSCSRTLTGSRYPDLCCLAAPLPHCHFVSTR